MNFEKVLFAFFIILALSLNFGFFVGDFNDPSHHHAYELFAALVASLLCTFMKFGDRTHFGSTVLASSLVADIQLFAAVIVWGVASAQGSGIDSETVASVTSLAGGALVANFISVVLLIIETSQIRK